MVKNPPANAGDIRDIVSIPGLQWEDPMEEKMATHCNILAWKIPCTEEPGGLPSIESQRDTSIRASQVMLVVKNLLANAEDIGKVRDLGSVPRVGRSPGGGNGTSLQYSCLENPTDRGAWWTTIQWVTKRQTQLKCTSIGYIPHIINMPL